MARFSVRLMHAHVMAYCAIDDMRSEAVRQINHMETTLPATSCKVKIQGILV